MLFMVIVLLVMIVLLVLLLLYRFMSLSSWFSFMCLCGGFRLKLMCFMGVLVD